MSAEQAKIPCCLLLRVLVINRLPWLEELQRLITSTLNNRQHGILACSALKSSYRQILRNNHPQVVVIYLRGSYDCIQSRLEQRTGHFMSASLLKSQFATLEEPEDALIFDVSLSPQFIVAKILSQID